MKEMNNVKRKLNGKNEVVVNGRTYRWNTAYHVYNDVANMEQLSWDDIFEALACPTRLR